MDTNAKQIGRCLPADVLDRIEVIKAREARTSAALSGSGAGEEVRAKPVVTESEATGNIIRLEMPKHMATAIPSRLPRAAVVICLDMERERRHAATPWR